MLWTLEKRSPEDEKESKVPYDAKSFRRAKSNDPETWCTYEVAEAALKASKRWKGLGFALGDGFAGVDLDACMENGCIELWAQKIIGDLDSYCEVSPSGTGVKIFVRATLERGFKKIMGSPKVKGDKAPALEVYATGRYFCVTGDCEMSLTDQCEERQVQIDELVKLYGKQPPQRATMPATPPVPHVPGVKTAIEERARRYLAKIPDAVSGQDGHGRTFRAACILVRGFSLSVDDAYPILAEWNETHCEPPWSDYDVRRKLEEADTKASGDRGYLLNSGRYTGNDVDLSRLIDSIAGQDSETGIPVTEESAAVVVLDEMPPKPVFEPIPKLSDDILYPPGFLGELVYHNNRTAWCVQPELALAGALALLATLTGGKISGKGGTRTNLYVMGLAPSRSGKEHARKINREVLRRAGVEELIGPEDIGSHAAIYSWMAEHPTMLFQIDEIGRKFATMKDAVKSPHLWNIISVWLKLWSSADSILTGDAYADMKKTKTLTYPHAVIYGTSVPESVWGSLSKENVSDGLLARFLVFEGRGYSELENNNDPDPAPVPDELIGIARSWRELVTHSGDMNSLPSNAYPAKMTMEEDAQQRWQEHHDQVVERRRKEDDTIAAVWSGTPEKTAKLALLFAASRWKGGGYPLPVIELQDMDRAIALANYLTRRMLEKAEKHVSENQAEGDIKRVIRLLENKGGQVDGTAFSRMTQWLGKRRDEVIHELIEGKYMTRHKVGAKTKSVTVYTLITSKPEPLKLAQ